ncbi:MAG: tetratricopeptide repeat protein [Acidobacteria bacterium]|nr:tetratricopeptide repeat protein [Acidobacteriota bacterium]
MKVLVIAVLAFFVRPMAGSPHNPELENAVRLYETGEFRKALDVFLELKGKAPENPEIRIWTGKSYLKVHKWENAVKEFEKSVALQPANAHNHLWLGRALGARAAHSIFFKAVGIARKVVAAFEKARELAPDNLDVRFDLIDFYLNAPGFIGGGKDKAEKEAKIISDLNAKLGYAARASILMKDKKWDQAKKELTQATIEFPQDPDPYNDLAGFLLDREDFSGAMDSAAKALALDKGSKRARLLLAAARIRLRTALDEAEKSLKELAAGSLTDEDPAFEEVYYWLGECYFAKGDKAKALDAYKSALDFDPWHEKAKKQLSKVK